MKRLIPLVALLLLVAPASGARSGGHSLTALVTAETENQLIAVSLPSGHVLRRLHMPADPENVDARVGIRTALVVSTRGRAVTLVDTRRLRIVRIIHGFSDPHIPAITPGGRYAYVTDDGSGKLNVIDLKRRRLVRRVFVGVGAHHMSISSDGRRAWVALGEHASRIVILNTSRTARPRVIGHLDPRGISHDVAFTSSGARVWVTSADSSRVGIYDARSRRLIKTFDGRTPPQHVVFVPGIHGRLPARGYVTSGYGGTIQLRNARTAALYESFRSDYGSFNLGVGGGYLAVASLLRGTVTLFSQNLSQLGHWHLAPAARDVAIF